MSRIHELEVVEILDGLFEKTTAEQHLEVKPNIARLGHEMFGTICHDALLEIEECEDLLCWLIAPLDLSGENQLQPKPILCCWAHIW